MPKNKKQYDDDDGRTIADMSDISRQPLIVPRFEKTSKKDEPEKEKKADDFQMTKEERRAYISGALGATAAISTVFIAAAGIVIFLITRLH